MVGVNQVTSSIVAGCVVSCGAVLVVAGASKLYRGARGVDGATAMRRALRMPRQQWRRAELAVGAAELAMGVLVCSRASPVLGGAGGSLVRRGVLRSARICARQTGSWRLRMYQVASGAGNDGGTGYLAGDGPQRDAAWRGHR